MARHRTQIGHSVHGPYQQAFANATARLADVGPYLSSESITGGSSNPIISIQTDTLEIFVLQNHSPVTWVAVASASTYNYRQDLADNTSDYIVVGSTLTDRTVAVEYYLILPVSQKCHKGRFEVLWEGATADISHKYSYISTEIPGLTWGAAVVSTEIRLTIVTLGVGENPVIMYTLEKLKVL